jgi:transcription-repair coupling factor (superfamily II helicase)
MTTSDVFLHDELAESLARQGERSPELRDLLATLRDGWGRADAAGRIPRVAVRGLAGSSRAYVVSWLQRQLDAPLLYVVAHGEAFEAARDDLEYFRGRGETLAFPEPDTLPYDATSPHPSVTAERLETLARLAAGESGVVVATVRGVLQRVPRPEKLARSVLVLRTGEDVDERELLERLVFMGYERLPEVESVGTFARRGGILDIWPVGQGEPIRAELDGDTIASLRRFDAGTQRSLEKLAAARVLPRYEIVVEAAEAGAIAQRLRDAGDEAAKGGSNLFHEGMERFAGYYDSGLVSLLDYLPPGTRVVVDDPAALADRAIDLGEGIARSFEETRAQYPFVSPPDRLFLPADAWEELHAKRPGADFMGPVAVAGEAARYAQVLLVDCAPAEPLQRSMEKLKNHLAELAANDLAPVILCDNAGQRDRLWEMLGNEHATLGVGLVSAGFTMRGAGIALLTDHEIFARYRRRRRRLRRTGGLSAAELSQLKPGDFVVHEDHGVGVYRGMKRLTLGGQETDCLELSYAEKDVLYVPVHQLSLVSRYAAGDGARPGLHRLGSAQWQKTKARAKKAIEDMAEELLKAYAVRHALPGHAFGPDSVWQRELEASFPYDETPDQL